MLFITGITSLYGGKVDDFFGKIKDGIGKAHNFKNENEQAKKNAPLWLMLLNDGLPLLVIVAYLLMGLLGNLWHPGWLIFFLIPIYYATGESIKHKSANMFPLPVIVVGVYLLLGFLKNWWHPGWIIFAAIPLYYAAIAMIKTRSIAKIVDVLLPLAVVGFYLGLGFGGGWWHPGWVVFFIIPIYYQIRETVKKYKRRNAAAKKDTDRIGEDGNGIDGEIN